jgi:hypothetical protein
VRNFNDIVTFIESTAFDPFILKSIDDLSKDDIAVTKHRMNKMSAYIVDVIARFPETVIFNNASGVYLDRASQNAGRIASYDQYYDLVEKGRIVDFFSKQFPDTMPFERMPVQAYHDIAFGGSFS